MRLLAFRQCIHEQIYYDKGVYNKDRYSRPCKFFYQLEQLDGKIYRSRQKPEPFRPSAIQP